MRTLIDPDKRRAPILCWADDADVETLRQAENLASLPFVVDHIALMPDAHVGFGMPIGGVVATEGVVIPNAVGVDIGCGMVAWRTGVAAAGMRPWFEAIVASIQQEIPVGFEHRRPRIGEKLAERWCPQLLGLLESRPRATAYLSGYDKIVEQVGTLGGGNHFIELQSDPDGVLWVMLHSGSRNVGLQINARFNKLAKQMHKSSPGASMGLSHLEADSDAGRDYIAHMQFALEFARCNRLVMMRLCQEIVRHTPGGHEASSDDADGSLINIHHNYAAMEEHLGRRLWVHRKGATSARAGQTGIIPGSMGTRSYIVRGLGSPASFMSCSHGAGRVMGRKQARERITMTRFKESMAGVLFDAKPANLDEAPDAYKDIDTVMASQRDLVAIVTELRPLAVVKG